MTLYSLLNHLGGFIWWLCVKFCRTSLKEEQAENKWSRNIFLMIVLIIFLGIVSVNFF